jgi:biopolymer transport protein ExbD
MPTTTAAAEKKPKASMLQVNREIRRKTRLRHEEHTPEELNIVAMMDMMTIILVFLLKSLASSAATIPQSDNLRLPSSMVQTAPSQALQVLVSRVSITVNGRFVAPLSNQQVDPSLKRGGASGFIINPLAEVMRNEYQRQRELSQRAGVEFHGEVAIIADLGLPTRTVYEVMYTCGQANFSKFHLLVLKGGRR